jgi:response regulator RpfG family c-di-GMP phosphodiesterase
MNKHKQHKEDSELVFAPEDGSGISTVISAPAWKILIIDDEPDVHEVTQMSLKNFEFDGRGLEFFNAFSALQAKEILFREKDIAVALVDVVMETEHAGLKLIKYIREEVKNDSIRLILRTGQPGQAPERQVIREYDINDYKEKTELTSQKLYSTIYTSLRSYRDFIALENNRRGLEHVIHATTHLFTIASLNDFIQGVLEQLVALLYLGDDSFYVGCECFAYENNNGEATIIAATGRYNDSLGKPAKEALDDEIYQLVKEARKNKKSILRDKDFVGYFKPHEGREDVLYINSHHRLSQRDLGLIDLFLHNVSIAYENLILHNEIEGTQRDMLYMLGDAIETRSDETGQHVRRVAEYSRLIALGAGLSEREAMVIEIAAPLHDIGKIGIPDHILHKPGKLDGDDWQIMQTHTRIGHELLNNSDRDMLKAAAIIAGQHHEHWNGSGYPDGLKGEQIHLYARIVAIADVFDALGTKRVYKDAWPMEKIIDYIKGQRNRQFDPVLIDWVLDNIESMKQVRELYPDTE